MPIKLTAADWRAIFPKAPQEVINAFAAKQAVLDKAGITATKTRLAYFLANIEHECGGFTIPNLTENLNYTAARMAKVWPNRFSSAAAVQAKFGTGKGWQIKAIDEIYGNRMGNRPGTSDGSLFIGRGGPQWTGRDGYANLQRITGLPVLTDPTLASRLDMQPEICAAFWTWKNLNRFADANDFLGCVKAWNGGTNGLADRKALMADNDPIIKRLEVVASVGGVVADKPTQPLPPFLEPGAKPAAKPPEKASTRDKIIGGVIGTVGTGAVTGGAVAVNQGVSALQVAAWIGGLFGVAIITFIIGYRIVKGAWPWTGKVSPEPSLPSPLQSDASLELASVQLALPSAALPATPSPQPSVSKPRRKRSAKPSQKTPTPRRSSSSSKPTAAKKSSPKRKSKSKG